MLLPVIRRLSGAHHPPTHKARLAPRSDPAAVRALVSDVAARVRSFKPPADKAVLERAIKQVAEFKAPGKYVLFDWCRPEVGGGVSG